MKTFEGRPFALLGVNSDPHLEDLQMMTQKGQTTWRNFWDGTSATGGGQILDRWQIEAFPTLVLIDARGVIRDILVGAPPAKALERKVGELVRQTEKSGRSS